MRVEADNKLRMHLVEITAITQRAPGNDVALLIDIRDPSWMTEAARRDIRAPKLPDISILCSPEQGSLDEVVMLAIFKMRPGLAARLPRLRLVQKLAAGVDGIVGDPDLAPDTAVCRRRPKAVATDIAEYCLAYVLRDMRNVRLHGHRSSRA